MKLLQQSIAIAAATLLMGGSVFAQDAPPLTTALEGILTSPDGTEFSREEAPEFYVLYHSASW